eukprot:CAMPEP_0197188562 /NCGR_PEP_ID=MMETSP1423-20130617/18015_1 /TAXON_ID=476441 /ORGANISM="Pseudo-nitzschia heimii, Strain UNC1101" /LENGTH=924 /DNA_ID=CAMNT_0042640429 /DNA_START=119 /DNA_END=2893 /DNA_ORIENTATION=+
MSSQENGPKIDFLQDDVREMTWGRRLAMKLVNNRFYNPSAVHYENNDEEGKESAEDPDRIRDDFEQDIILEKPCLKKAWAYFEHNALYRYMVREKGTYDLAIPGDDTHPTRLYPWLLLPHRELGDFGLGIGLYFSTLRYLIVVLIVAGLISIGNIMYYAGPEYGVNGSPAPQDFYDYIHYGSALCALENFDFVPCPGCNCQTKETTLREKLSARGTSLIFGQCTYANATDGSELTFAAHPTCSAVSSLHLPAYNFASLVFVAVALVLLGRHVKKEQVRFDEDEQTARDYSIQIENPPADAKDPEEWKGYFRERFDAQAAVCTCAVPNDDLLKTLVARRELLRKIFFKQPGKTLDIEKLAKDAAEDSGLSKLYSKLLDLEEKVKELSQLEYPVTNVFVTFETEEDQREVLKQLDASRSKAKRNGSSAGSDNLFRGEIVLQVREAEEPDTIRWQDLNSGFSKRFSRQLGTMAFTVGMMVFALWTLHSVRTGNLDPSVAGILSFIYGFVVPTLDRILIDVFEIHHSETGRQASIYSHSVIFNVFNNCIIPLFITPFFLTLLSGIENEGFGLVPFVSFIMFMTAFAPLIFGVVDIGGIIKRHIMAPRAKTQDAMNLYFQGDEWDLSLEYTQMTVSLFMATIFSSIFPTGYFFAAAGMAVQYFHGKQKLLRHCKRALSLGATITYLNRLYWYPLVIFAMAFMNSLLWTGFPYDNLCPTEDSDSAYIGNWSLDTRYTAVDKAYETATANVTSSSVNYKVCNQNFLFNWPTPTFPFVPSMGNAKLDPEAYMTPEQITSTTYFGWTAAVVMLLCTLKLLWSWYKVYRYIRVGRIHEAVGESQDILYSSVKSRCAYIPEMKSDLFAYPLIGCPIDGIHNDELFNFKDPLRSYRYYDLSVDARKILETDEPPACFTVVKSWEPDTSGRSCEIQL